MGLSSVRNEDKAMSSGDVGLPNEDDMDLDDIDGLDDFDHINIRDLGEDFLKDFCRKAAASFFNEYGLISHQLNSYNNFIKHGLQKVFDSFEDIVVEPTYDPSKKGDGDWRYASVRFGKVSIERPTFWANDKELNFLPRHARLQNMTYSSRIRVNVQVQVYTKKLVKSDKFKTGTEEHVDMKVLNEINQDIPIGRIPVMVNSDLCWMNEAKKGDCAFDHGGYFVIKGAEKVFIAQEQICTKRLWVSSAPVWTVSYRSEMKRNLLLIRLGNPSDAEDTTKDRKPLNASFLSTEIPLWIFFYALGISSDREAIDLIDFDCGDAGIRNIFFDSIHYAEKKCEGFRRGTEALNYVGEKIKGTSFPPKESINECISKYMFPGLQGPKQKARFMGYMVKCLLMGYTGRRKCENRDSFRNKRVELAGELLDRELKVHLAHARKTMIKSMQRHLTGDGDLKPVEHYVDASIVTNGLSRAFSTGAWSHPFKKMERISGVIANLGRANPLQTLIDLRRTRQPVLYTGKVGDARYPHPSHWGRVCFLSTPDGENCGLVKNMSSLGLVSTEIMEPVLEKFLDFGMEKLVDDTVTSIRGKHKVFLNGDWIGICEDANSFVAELKSRRRQKDLPHQMEIKRDDNEEEVRIFTDAGRLLRPLLVVENLPKLKQDKPIVYSFQNLLDQGIIELIGVEEEEDCHTAWGITFLLEDKGGISGKYTHCDLDMSFLLGVSCGIVPFANHDHARRVLYQSQKHCQQAIGFSTTNPNIRVDTLSHQLFYPQKPLFRTMTSDILGNDGLYNGQNAIVAVNVHLGYNQEDSIVMNKASLERGMFRSEHIRSYKAEVDIQEPDKKKKLDEHVSFGKTQSTIGRVDSLDDDGFPFVGANLQSGDVVIGRCTESGADHSIKLKHTERGMVQKVVLSSNDDGKNFAAVSLRQVRSPSLGDKFSSMHGQKGVLGYLESQENFHFTVQGIVPDIVINPHAFPSRQTTGQLLEAVLAKGIACVGTKGKTPASAKLISHATPFSTPSVDEICDQLHRAGFSKWGHERLYRGTDAKMIKSLIFIGPTFYQRLVHMAEDKVKFRNTGPVHPLTRQPVADRKRFGGIKFGEMERDCLLAHGASSNLHERLFTLSDSSQIHICKSCQNIANVIQRGVSGGRKIRGPYCRICESADNIIRVNVPYGAKLLSQELFSMGVNLKFDTRLC